jgi:hypothetical protein
MIKLHPIPTVSFKCPYDNIDLEPVGWYIPGMRTLADLRCPECGLRFYGDLPAGHGLYYPMLLEQATGIVHDRYGIGWSADWLRDSYAQRVDTPMELVVEEFRPLGQPVLLNCIDTLYGHCLLKLLNAQYYLDHRPDLDIILLIPRCLRWMVPDGVAAVWTVDLPLRQGIEWNDWLADEIKRRIAPLSQCWLSIALSHPYPEDYDIQRFSRVPPFPINEWDRHQERPTITFIWREDRVWPSDTGYSYVHRIVRKLTCRVGLRRRPTNKQRRQVVALAQTLRSTYPGIDFAVVGQGHRGRFPTWITDLRSVEIDKSLEKSWCERYSKSHIVIGVHGSNMLLPSAHAGATVELVPQERWGNLVQDILLEPLDPREALLRYRFLPIGASAATVGAVTIDLLRHLSDGLRYFKRPWCQHETLGQDRLPFLQWVNRERESTEDPATNSSRNTV